MYTAASRESRRRAEENEAKRGKRTTRCVVWCVCVCVRYYCMLIQGMALPLLHLHHQVRLRSFTTKVHKVDAMVAYKSCGDDV